MQDHQLQRETKKNDRGRTGKNTLICSINRLFTLHIWTKMSLFRGGMDAKE
jgi:hypothetical protein